MAFFRAAVTLMRPAQWLKNTFIFLPLFFDKKLFDMPSLVSAGVMFAAFCCVASSIYCFNDVLDAGRDRQHPKKKFRPVASGDVSVPAALMLTVLLATTGMIFAGGGFNSLKSSLGFAVNQRDTLVCCGILGFYYLQNILYCTVLKRFALVDVFVIAFGFLLRLFLGAVASGVALSHWIVLMTFLLALFLAFAKRRDDVVMYENTGVKLRGYIHRYNLAFMNQAITVIGTVTIVCYISYTVSPDVIARLGSDYLYLTSIFVLAGIIRYLQLTIVDVKSGSPTRVLMHDRFTQVTVVLWLLSFLGILYA